MALITTASTDNGTIDLFGTMPAPLGVDDSAIPIGEQVFDGSVATTLSGATDTATWTLQCNLERNYVHKLVDFQVQISAAGTADMAEWEPGMTVLCSTDKAGLSSVFENTFELRGDVYQRDPTSILVAFRSHASTNPYQRFFHPIDLPGDLLDASDAGRLFLRWFNESGAATATVTAKWHARTLIYTIDALNTWNIHTPRLSLRI